MRAGLPAPYAAWPESSRYPRALSGSLSCRARMKALTTTDACTVGEGSGLAAGAVAAHSVLPRTYTNVLESGAQTGARNVPSESLVRSVPSGRIEKTPVSEPSSITFCADHVTSPSGSLYTVLPCRSAMTFPNKTRWPLGDQPWNVPAAPDPPSCVLPPPATSSRKRLLGLWYTADKPSGEIEMTLTA